MIKTIIFDIGGVITRTNFNAIYYNFAKRVGLTPEFVTQYFESNLVDMLLGNITLQKTWDEMISAGADKNLNLQNIWTEEGLKIREMNEELLNKVKELRKSYSVGVLTNLSPARLLLDEKINLYSYFDYAVLSCKEHVMKPDPASYLLSLKVAGVGPNEAIFIDNEDEYIEGAQSVGIPSILYKYPENLELAESLSQLGVNI